MNNRPHSSVTLSDTDRATAMISNFIGGADHFDPYQGFVGNDKELNLRFGFKVGNVNFLISESMPCEVIQNSVIYPLPNSPNIVLGLINLRGILLPAIDLKAFVSKEEIDTKNPETLLVLEQGNRAFAIYADELPTAINIDEAEINTINDVSQHKLPCPFDYVDASYMINSEIWHEINFRQFILKMIEQETPGSNHS